jgi:hypothetical protein
LPASLAIHHTYCTHVRWPRSKNHWLILCGWFFVTKSLVEPVNDGLSLVHSCVVLEGCLDGNSNQVTRGDVLWLLFPWSVGKAYLLLSHPGPLCFLFRGQNKVVW